MRNTLQSLMGTIFNLSAITAVALLAVPLIGLVLPPLMLLYYGISRYYRHSSRELQRMQSVSRSPIYSSFAETLQGADTVTVFDCQQHFLCKHRQLMDESLRSGFIAKAADLWLVIRLEFIGTLFVTCTALMVAFEWHRGNISPGMAGLALSYVAAFPDNLNWLVRSFAQAEIQMVAVERLDAVCTLPSEHSEPDGEQSTARILGNIEFRNLSMRYRPELPNVLVDVSFKIAAGEWVGICGRSGSGKSSLVSTVFLLTQPSQGAVLIDGIDTRRMPLHILRSSMAIIPQTPVIFSTCSLRFNLDPSGTKEDTELWAALDQASLGDSLRSSEVDFGAPLKEQVSFSAGQLQLLCLARALLADRQIVVLDEATSSIDLDTQAVVQQTLLDSFVGKTILTIAHRVDTLFDYNQILVLQKGQIVETGSPNELRADPSSRFSQMCNVKR